MTTQVRHPVWLPAYRQAGAGTFATLFAIESFARATVSSVIPIQAYELLQSEREVSLLYTAVSLTGLFATLFMPMLITRFSRRWVYSAGIVSIGIGSILFSTHTMSGQATGMLLRVMGASSLAITLNLYIMDHIHRTEFIRAESMRMAWSMIAWTCGPTLGVVLYSRFGILAPNLVVIFFAVLLLATFWYFRLTDNPVIRPGRTPASNPLRNIGRFVAQPRLRLAWLIAFGRSCFWTTFFVYGPILMVVTGEGKLAGGLLVSGGNAMLFTAIYWGRAGQRFGARNTLVFSFLALAASLVAAGFCGESLPLLAGFFLLGSAFFAVALDSLGSTAFMRAVHVHERPQMTAVYRTYLDFSELTPPLVYAVVLSFFGLGAVFVTLGVFVAACGLVVLRFLPRRM